ncbi:MAG: hypothetical protein WC943_15305 [Elusimicrobiota bacterium]
MGREPHLTGAAGVAADRDECVGLAAGPDVAVGLVDLRIHGSRGLVAHGLLPVVAGGELLELGLKDPDPGAGLGLESLELSLHLLVLDAGRVELFHELEDAGLDGVALGLGAVDLVLERLESLIRLDLVEILLMLADRLFLGGQVELGILLLLLEIRDLPLHCVEKGLLRGQGVPQGLDRSRDLSHLGLQAVEGGVLLLQGDERGQGLSIERHVGLLSYFFPVSAIFSTEKILSVVPGCR